MNTFRQHAIRWILPLVLVVALIGARLRVLPSGSVLILAIVSETLTVVLGSVQAWRALRRLRQRRRAGADIWDALTDGIAVFVPRPIARIIALEPRVWACIFIWLFRRPKANATTFPYAAESIMGVFLIAILFSAPIEVLLAEVLVPWGWLRILLVVLEVYSIIWLLGYSASLAVLPHHLGNEALVLRYGLLLDACIPLANIAEIAPERRSSPNGRDGYVADAARRELALVVGGTTNVRLTLHASQTFSGLLRPTPAVDTIFLKVDDPDRFIAAVRARLAPADALLLVNSASEPNMSVRV